MSDIVIGALTFFVYLFYCSSRKAQENVGDVMIIIIDIEQIQPYLRHWKQVDLGSDMKEKNIIW